jgi:uncharacterized C2H2 Zn-finger protein
MAEEGNNPQGNPESSGTPNPVRTFRCGDCGKEFGSESSLNQHKNDAHGVAPEKSDKPKQPMKIGKMIPYMILGIVVVGIGFGVYYWVSGDGATGASVKLGALGSTHIHADYAIYVNGQQVDMSSPSNFQRSSYVHMHQPYDSLIHVHATGATLGLFLNSIGIKLDADCLDLAGTKYCNDGENTLKVYFKTASGDWTPNLVYGNYVIQDIDKIMITYGNDSEEQIAEQQESVTSLAIQASTGAIGG